MKNDISAADERALTKCPLFAGKTIEDIRSFLTGIDVRIRSFSKDETLAHEKDPAQWLLIVLSGSVEIHKIHPSGDSITLARFTESCPVGEAALFTKENAYPATVVATEASRVLMIHKEQLTKLFSVDTEFLMCFMESLSERILLLNQKIEALSLGSLRQRIAHSLLSEVKKQNSTSIQLPFSKRIWAEHLNMPRPSLSRELGQMRDLGWLAFYGKHITVLDVEALKKLLG